VLHGIRGREMHARLTAATWLMAMGLAFMLAAGCSSDSGRTGQTADRSGQRTGAAAGRAEQTGATQGGEQAAVATGGEQAELDRVPTADVTIGVSLLTRTHPFYQDLERGMLDAAAEHGYELVVQAGEFDVAKQKDQIENFIVRRVNAIIVCPCDSKSIGTSVAAANAEGIPVFTADIAVLAPGVQVVCHVASDNVAGGRLAAQAVSEALGGRGKVAVIDHPEVESVIQRVRGFEEEIATMPGVQIVAKLTGRGMKDMAFRTAEDILQAHPDLDAIFGINDDSALGALAAVEKAGRRARVKIVGFDAVPEARKAIADGKIYADVVQQPRLIGTTTIGAIAAYMSGREVPPEILIPCQLFKQADARAENGAQER
jgi:ribose transport system substrate-binding protein